MRALINQRLGYRNFYVITRYNRSPMYALAVHQLAQAIRSRVGASPTGMDAGTGRGTAP